MQFSLFGTSGHRVSRLGFGAMGLGGAFGTYDEQFLVRSVLHSLDKGVTFIDTARLYGNSEHVIGKALKEWSGERPFIASKVRPHYPSGLAWGKPVPVQETFPPGSLKDSVEESLNQLGVDHIDLIQLHQYWPQWNKEDYWLEELNDLKTQGKVRYIGISIPDQRHDIALPIVQSGKIDSVQTVFNIFDPLALDCLIPACQENGVAFIARCIMDEGGLTGFLTKETVFGEGDFRESYFDCVPREMYIERVNRLRAFIPEYAHTLAELAIKFVLHHPGVTTALTSMHITEYADENIASVNKDPLPDSVFEDIFRHHRWIRNFFDSKYW